MTSPALDQKALAAALACPFCGSRAIHIDRGEEPDRSLPLQHRPAVKPWSVICIDCNCRALGGTEDSAMRAWNRRAALPAPEPVARRPSTPVLDQIIAFPAGHEFEVSELGKSKTIYNAAQYSYTAGYTQKIRRGRYRRTDKAPPLYASPPSHQGLREATFRRGDRVSKKSGASWNGVVVGEYSSSLTAEGYCVESEREPGSVQLYPAAALQSQPAPSGREVGWLIERKNFDGNPVPYWYVENAMGFHWWTPVAFDAKRFATKAEAEAYPAYQMIASDPTISITEHIFLSPAQPAPSGETK